MARLRGVGASVRTRQLIIGVIIGLLTGVSSATLAVATRARPWGLRLRRDAQTAQLFDRGVANCADTDSAWIEQPCVARSRWFQPPGPDSSLLRYRRKLA